MRFFILPIMSNIACYILFSKQSDKFYIGITQEGVEQRLEMHNTSGYGNHFTSVANDWVIYHVINCSSVSQSMKIEKHIKRMKSRKYIENLKLYPAMTEKLLNEYS
jgi:putative endonuclease